MNILVAEDDLVTRNVLAGLLKRWGHEVVACADGLEAQAVLAGGASVDLAILDWIMPGKTGLEVLTWIRQRGGLSYIYVILLTAKDNKADLVDALTAGADEYLVKPFDTLELKARLLVGQRILDLQYALLTVQEALAVQATHDMLTGMLNRAGFHDAFSRELARAAREGTPLAVVLADVDHFKRINDTWGHQAGDVVLQTVARQLKDCLRPYDLIGRYGGEEFVIVLPGCGASGAVALAERLRTQIAQEVITFPGGSAMVTASLGVAVSPRGDVTPDTLIRAADRALYRAKQRGRNRVELAEESDYRAPEMAPDQRAALVTRATSLPAVSLPLDFPRFKR